MVPAHLSFSFLQTRPPSLLPRPTGGTNIKIDIKSDSSWLRLRDGIRERRVLDTDRSSPKVVRKKLFPQRFRGKPVVRHERAPEPHTLVVLDIVICSIGEPEAVRPHTIFVVHHLRMGSVPPHTAGVPNLVVAVLRCTHILCLARLLSDPDSDMFPVVGVASVQKVLDRHVFLEVVPVQVDAPAAVAAVAHIDVVVVEVGGVPAVCCISGKVVG